MKSHIEKRYHVYRVHIDERGCMELNVPAGQVSFRTEKEAEEAIIENTHTRMGLYPLWYEEFDYIIIPQLKVVEPYWQTKRNEEKCAVGVANG